MKRRIVAAFAAGLMLALSAAPMAAEQGGFEYQEQPGSAHWSDCGGAHGAFGARGKDNNFGHPTDGGDPGRQDERVGVPNDNKIAAQGCNGNNSPPV